ncbi:MAG TPA: amino acid permease [Blastocatellia bacterium]|nr:amino acid permease [Blastocatellia bacterium]
MTKLARILNFRDLTLLIIGSVIGSGIFLVPGGVLKQVDGRIAPALMVWLVGGLLSLLGALTYGELSTVNPKAGGLYVHIRDCFGPMPAFLFGWTLFFAIGGGTVATLAVAFSNTLAQVITLSPEMKNAIALAMILVVTVVNVIGTRTSADVQNWTTVIKAGAIILMSVALLLFGHGFQGTSATMWPSEINGSLASGFMIAMVSVLWAYEGWQYCTFSAGEIVNPQRDFPRAFLIGTVSLIAIYLLANVAYLAALGPAGVAQSDSVAAASLTAVVNPTAATLITIAISISIFSAANSNVLTSPRVYYAMATDGLFFKQLANVHPRFGTPAFAIIAGSLWSAVLAMAGTFNELLTLVVFSGWIFYALAAASIFVYRKRQPDVERSYRTPGYPFTPLLFIIAAVVLIINTLSDQLSKDPLRTLKALSVIVLGIPAYFVWRTLNKTDYRSAENSEAD